MASNSTQLLRPLARNSLNLLAALATNFSASEFLALDPQSGLFHLGCAATAVLVDTFVQRRGEVDARKDAEKLLLERWQKHGSLIAALDHLSADQTVHDRLSRERLDDLRSALRTDNETLRIAILEGHDLLVYVGRWIEQWCQANDIRMENLSQSTDVFRDQIREIHLEIRDQSNSVAEILTEQRRNTALLHALTEAFNQQRKENDEEIAQRLRDVIEHEVTERLRAEYEQQLVRKNVLIDELVAGFLAAYRVPSTAKEMDRACDIKRIVPALQALAAEQGFNIETLRQVAAWAFLVGAPSEAIASLQTILKIVPGDPQSLNRLGEVYLHIGEAALANDAFTQLLNTGRGADREYWEAIAKGNIAITWYVRGDLARAEELMEEALKSREQTKDQEGISVQCSNLSLVCRSRGDLLKAEELCKRALALDEKLGRLGGITANYDNLGRIARVRGDWKKADAMHTRALAAATAANNRSAMASQNAGLGVVAGKRGLYARAEELLRKALDIKIAIGQEAGIASVRNNLGTLYCDQGRLDESEAMHVSAMKIDELHCRTEGIIAANIGLGNVFFKRGDSHRAIAFYLKAVGMSEASSRSIELGTAYGNLGAAYVMDKNLADGRAALLKAIAIDEAAENPAGQATHLANLGEASRMMGDFTGARGALQKAMMISRKKNLHLLANRIEGWLKEIEDIHSISIRPPQ